MGIVERRYEMLQPWQRAAGQQKKNYGSDNHVHDEMQKVLHDIWAKNWRQLVTVIVAILILIRWGIVENFLFQELSFPMVLTSICMITIGINGVILLEFVIWLIHNLIRKTNGQSIVYYGEKTIVIFDVFKIIVLLVIIGGTALAVFLQGNLICLFVPALDILWVVFYVSMIRCMRVSNEASKKIAVRLIIISIIVFAGCILGAFISSMANTQKQIEDMYEELEKDPDFHSYNIGVADLPITLTDLGVTPEGEESKESEEGTGTPQAMSFTYHDIWYLEDESIGTYMEYGFISTDSKKWMDTFLGEKKKEGDLIALDMKANQAVNAKEGYCFQQEGENDLYYYVYDDGILFWESSITFTDEQTTKVIQIMEKEKEQGRFQSVPY